MTLVDTCVWIDHLRKGEQRLVDLLTSGAVVTHPFIVGELACGHLDNRREIIASLLDLPSTGQAADEEILFLIDTHGLAGKGIGLIDVHLIASCLLESHCLWSKDKRLAAVAADLGVSAD